MHSTPGPRTSIETREYRRLQAVDRAHREQQAAEAMPRRDVREIARSFAEKMVSSMTTDLRQREPSLTKEQATARVLSEHPDLYDDLV